MVASGPKSKPDMRGFYHILRIFLVPWHLALAAYLAQNEGELFQETLILTQHRPLKWIV